MISTNGWTRSLLMGAFAAGAVAAVAQVHTEGPDAGNLAATAQAVAAGTTTIDGALGFLGDQDLFRVFITDFGKFSVTVSGQDVGGADVTDTQLFLFRLDGSGLAHNDDVNTTNTWSHLPVGNALYVGLTPGEYIVGISSWDDDPYFGVTDTDLIFPNPGYDGEGNGEVVGPRPAAVGMPVLLWDGVNGAEETGTYRLNLTGVDAVPEPATLAALGVGAAALLRKRRK